MVWLKLNTIIIYIFFNQLQIQTQQIQNKYTEKLPKIQYKPVKMLKSDFESPKMVRLKLNTTVIYIFLINYKLQDTTD